MIGGRRAGRGWPLRPLRPRFLRGQTGPLRYYPCESAIPATDTYVAWSYDSSISPGSSTGFVVDSSGGSVSGSNSLHGPDISNSQYWQISADVWTYNGAVVSFFEKVSSEGGFDFGRFYVDGAQMLSVSGVASSFLRRSYGFGAGHHTLQWKFSKDPSVSSGLDNWFLDDIQVANLTLAPPPIKPRVVILRHGSLVSVKRMGRG